MEGKVVHSYVPDLSFFDQPAPKAGPSGPPTVFSSGRDRQSRAVGNASAGPGTSTGTGVGLIVKSSQEESQKQGGQKDLKGKQPARGGTGSAQGKAKVHEKDKNKGVRPKSPAYVLPSDFPLASLLASRELADRVSPKRTSATLPEKGTSHIRNGAATSRGLNVERRTPSSGQDTGVKRSPIPSSSQIVSKAKSGHGPSSKRTHDSLRRRKQERERKRTPPSGSDDELSLGSTPPDHQHAFKREGSSPIDQSSPSFSKSSSKIQPHHTSSRVGNTAKDGSVRKKHRVLAAASQDHLRRHDHDMTPKQRRQWPDKDARRGKKRISDELDSDTDITSGSNVDDALSPVAGTKRKSSSRPARSATRAPKVESSDDEPTPRPKRRWKSKVKSGSSSEDQSGSDKENKPLANEKRKDASNSPSRRTSGATFFAQLEKYSSDNEVDYGMLKADTGQVHEQEEELDHDDLSPEDNAYLATFRSDVHLCPYCSEPMPVAPSDHLRKLQVKLGAISEPRPTALNPEARYLPWQQSINFCALHRAETKTIPLGIRDGYPEFIDFAEMEKRLEQGWIREHLDDIGQNPDQSPVFQAVVNQIREMGKMKWASLKHQSKEELLQAVMPGYYGELGRAVMVNHFLQLFRWGYLPGLKPAQDGSPILIDPLSTNDFISHVLVPEAAILLIMSDNQTTAPSRTAYTEAADIRAKSVNYGRWKFREDEQSAKTILQEQESGKEEKRQRLRQLRKAKRAAAENRKLRPSENEQDGRRYEPIPVREDSTSVDSVVILDKSSVEANVIMTGKRKATTPLRTANSQLSESFSQNESVWGDDIPAEMLAEADEVVNDHFSKSSR